MGMMRGLGPGMAAIAKYDVCVACGKKGVLEALRPYYLGNRNVGSHLKRYCRYCQAGAFITGPAKVPDGTIVHGKRIGEA